MKKLAALLVAVTLTAGGLSFAQPEPADAYPWDPHVLVTGSVSTCGPTNSNGGWGWFSASNGESGWATWGGGSTFSFRLNRVPTSGVNISFKWGVKNYCYSPTRNWVIHRPWYGNNAPIGYLG